MTLVVTSERATGSLYALYGMPVLSDVPLPIPPICDAAGLDPAWSFVRQAAGQAPPEPDGPLTAESSCNCAVHAGATYSRVFRGPGGAWLWANGIGMFHVLPGARRIDVYVDPTADARALGLTLVGHVSTFVLQQLGLYSLHASAVVTDRGAVGFVGPNGRGKSTLAAGFVRRGAALLTDDALPLEVRDAVYGRPGVPMMKLWPEAVKHSLAVAHDLPHLLPNYDKRLFVLNDGYPFAQAPAIIRAVYVLNRYEPDANNTDIMSTQLTRRDAVATLLAHTSHSEFLLPSESPALLRVCARLASQAAVRVLSYPNGFDHQVNVYEQVMADLAVA